MECLEKDPAQRPASVKAVSIRLRRPGIGEPVDLGAGRRWWAPYRPGDGRLVADVLLSQEGRELRITRAVRPEGSRSLSGGQALRRARASYNSFDQDARTDPV